MPFQARKALYNVTPGQAFYLLLWRSYSPREQGYVFFSMPFKSPAVQGPENGDELHQGYDGILRMRFIPVFGTMVKAT